MNKAWVVFSGKTEIAWLRFLKPGFRHCSVVMSDGQNWVTFDPLSNYTDIIVHDLPSNFDLPMWLKDRGHKVLPAKLIRKKQAAPWMLLTCVESVKRFLGIHKRGILTPWQLYKYLKNQMNTEKGDVVWEV